MSGKAKLVMGSALFLCFIFFVGWRLGWFADEPAYNGKTVTQWLDTIVLLDRQTNAQGVSLIPRTPAQLTNQPGYHALLSIGARAVPVLMQRVMDLPEQEEKLSLLARWKQYAGEKFQQIRTGRKPPGKPSPTYPRAQRDRKDAAGFVLVALGTNAQGGFTRFLEAYATAPKPRVAGPLLGVYPSDVARAGGGVSPERRDELLAAITAGMQHTNGEYRRVAANAASAFPEEAEKWKPLFVRLTKDTDQYAPQAALSALFYMMPDDELMRTVEDITQDEQRSERVRELARAVLRRWDRNPTKEISPK